MLTCDPSIHQMFATVYDAGPTLDQHRYSYRPMAVLTMKYSFHEMTALHVHFVISVFTSVLSQQKQDVESMLF